MVGKRALAMQARKQATQHRLQLAASRCSRQQTQVKAPEIVASFLYAESPGCRFPGRVSGTLNVPNAQGWTSQARRLTLSC
eukprot:363811-Chlamydomonas_euryale.AAC.19